MEISESRRKEIVGVFEEVQRVPYYLLKHRDSRRLFSLNKGCCAEKTTWLGNRFKSLGLSIKYFLIEFNWGDLPVPDDILKLKEACSGYHLAMKVGIDGRWVWVDPTWDPALERLGFPVTRDWDGRSDTLLAVKPLKVEEFDPEDPSDTDLNEKFMTELNKHLERARRTP